MRIIGQNILCCRVKDCEGGKQNKSLQIIVEESRIIEKEFDPELVKKMAAWMDWIVLVSIAQQVFSIIIKS